MRAFFRNLLLSFLVAAAFPAASGTVAAADATPSSVLAAPECPAGTNWTTCSSGAGRQAA